MTIEAHGQRRLRESLQGSCFASCIVVQCRSFSWAHCRYAVGNWSGHHQSVHKARSIFSFKIENNFLYRDLPKTRTFEQGPNLVRIAKTANGADSAGCFFTKMTTKGGYLCLH